MIQHEDAFIDRAFELGTVEVLDLMKLKIYEIYGRYSSNSTYTTYL